MINQIIPQMLTVDHEYAEHPELWERLWRRYMLTQQDYVQVNYGSPSRRREKINTWVADMYEQFCIDMENGEV